MKFKIIDTTTDEVIYEIARKGHLVSCDIDDFYVSSDGQIILVDDCGNAAWVDRKRFKVVEQSKTGHWIIDGHHRRCSECGEYYCIKDIEGDTIPDKYCPNCGAGM